MGAGAKAGTARLGLLALIGMLLALALFASPASAKKTHLFLETFGSAAQPTFNGSTNLALDPSGGDLYVLSPGGGFDKGEISRFKPNGEPEPFSALGTNTIDARPGPGGKPCAEEAASCDDAPQVGFTFNSSPTGQGLAVDDSGTLTDGNIYITEWEHFGQGLTRFADYFTVFAADGHYLGRLTMAGATPLKEVSGVTVDSDGNVYASEYRPEVIGPKSEILEESESRIHKFDPSANPPLSSDLVATFTFPSELVYSLAAGAGPTAGSLFARAEGPEGTKVLKLNAASGAVEGVIPPTAGVSGSSKAVSVDPFDGHVFTEEREYEMSGASPVLLAEFNALFGTASNSATERLYASAGGFSESKVRVLGPIVTLPEVATGSSEITGDTSARVKGTVNPDGQALSDCTFEYGPTSAYGQVAPCEAPNAAEVGAGAAPVEVHADLSGLQGESEYHYRLVARNANAALYPNDPSAVVKGADQIFKTPSKPGIKGLWATNVIVTEATLKATVNPENATTAYRFEWGLDSSYGESTAEINLGTGNADHTVGFNLSGLEPATTYHYRVVATNAIGVTEAADRQFTTFAVPAPPGGECENEASRTGFGALLPDCRAYEMVSPLDKDGGDIRVLETSLQEPAVLEQASDSGEKLAYGSIRSFGDAASAPYTSQYIAQRIAGAEWQTHSINSPRGRPVVPTIQQFDTEFKAFSPDLCQAWFGTYAEPPLAEGALPGLPNLYRRTDQLCEEGAAPHYEALAPTGLQNLAALTADGSHLAFTTPVELLPEGTAGQVQLYEHVRGVGLHFVCILPDRTPTSGSCTAGSATPGGVLGAQVGRISSDGSRIFWAAPAAGEGKLYLRQNPEAPESARLNGAATGKGDLIGPAAGTGNVISGSELVKGAKATSGAFAAGQEVSSANGGIPAKTTIVKVDETSPGVFTLTLSAKATKTKLGDALSGAASATVPGIVTESGAFEAGQEITAPAIPPGATVLSCSPSCGPGATSLTLSAKATETKAGVKLSATSPCTEAATKACTIAVSKAGEEASGTEESWFWGASTDGSAAIFSTEIEPNNSDLYEFDVEAEESELIAEGVYGVLGIGEDAGRVYFASGKVLSGEEANGNGEVAQSGKANLYLREADGSIEFIATLAVLDLGQAVSQESYRDRTAQVSPSGAHAVFGSVAPLTAYDNICGDFLCQEIYRYDAEADELHCASCNPSGARPTGGGSIPFWQTPTYAARLLTEDGSRLYFGSHDALTPRDTNGAADVYQWEEPGTGSCKESSPTYSPQNGGCVDLISTGKSPLGSRFVEASPSGEDVFIATGSGLLPQDPGGVDIYDARVNGGLPIPAGPPPGCEGEACQSAPEAPDDPTPSSLTFEGAGNVHEAAPPTRRTCAKGKVRRKGRCVAKHHKRAKQRAKRHRRAGR